MKEQNETTPIPYPADPADTKRQLLIFLLVAYGVTYAMGILTWYGSVVSAELSAFPNAQMYYPAAGVMLAYMITRWRDDMLPKWFFLCFTLLTIAMLLCAVLSVFLPPAGKDVRFTALAGNNGRLLFCVSCFSWLCILAGRPSSTLPRGR